LLVADDEGDPDGAVTAAQRLVDSGVVAIIGHMTSSQSLAAYPYIEAAEVVLLSPTSTTPQLTGIDDFFFRIVPTHVVQAVAFAEYIYQTRGIVRLASIRDSDNAAYSQSYWDTFAAAFQGLGGQVTMQHAFDSAGNPDFAQSAQDLLSGEPEAILIIASAFNTALIAQQIRQINKKTSLFSSAWAQTEVLIQNGGRAVEGLEMAIAFDSNSQSAAYRDFQTRYEEKFGLSPTFAAGEAYECAFILFQALAQTEGEAANLPDALRDIDNVSVLNDPISIDEFGDVIRSNFIIVIEDGRFVTHTTLSPPH
jgi:branched-chain amino acid transport system substrate-binding protein